VPADSGNSRCFGIEAANAGTGAEAWTQAQQNSYIKMNRALCNAYRLVPATDIRSHAEWSPPRKIDPKGPSRWSPDNSKPWNMNAFRDEVASTLPAPIPPSEDDMPRLSNPLLQATGKDGTFTGAVYMTDGLLSQYWWIPTEQALNDVKYMLRVAGLTDAIQVVDNLSAFGVRIGPAPG